jgi:carbamoyltransferase
MSQLILTVHTGIHDAGAALYEDYIPLAAVQLERLTRRKGDGSEYPDRCIEEVLAIAGATRKDVDVIGASRCEFPAIFYRNIRGVRWVNEQYRKYIKKRTRPYMVSEFLRYNTARIDDIFNVSKFRRASGFRDNAKIYFYNHHSCPGRKPHRR